MRVKQYILLAVTVLTAFIAGLFIGKGRTVVAPGTATETKVTTVDTIAYNAPVPQSEMSLGSQRYALPGYRSSGDYADIPKHRGSNDSISVDSVATAHYGTGFGGNPRSNTDSAIVELPVIQRHYADSTYEAWISGPVDPRLDSVRVYAPTTIITKRGKPPKHWHVGLTAGYGYGVKGFHPYVGIGITYSIISF